MMNIFLLHKNLRKCAQEHVDLHVIKMILEHVQILFTVIYKCGEQTPYRPTHKNHPCVLWCGKSRDNWNVLKKLTEYLNEEYKYRYNKETDHKSWTAIKDVQAPKDLPNIGITKFAQAMPEKYRQKSTVDAYRDYYNNEKRHIAVWTNRPVPEWWKTELAVGRFP